MQRERVRVSKEFSFDMAHALFNYDGDCKNIHGHTYRLQVTLLGFPDEDKASPKLGMVVDFGIIKKIVKEKIIDKYDHSLVLNRASVNALGFDLSDLTEKLYLVDYQPTCENLLLTMKNELLDALEIDGFVLQSMRLYETPSSWAEWLMDDKAV
jgi:6-pyruvoyltetrahydropterin/6-carboxytetrahydropterin synthase